MTSPRFSANKQAALYDFKRSFIRLIPPCVISFLLAVFYFVFLPAITFLSVGNSKRGDLDVEQIRKELACVLFGNQGLNPAVIGVLTLIVGVLFAFWAFLPIMRKSSVNFFFSTSVDRKTYFKNRTLASIILMALSTLIPIVIDIITNISILGHADYMLYQGSFLFLEHFTYMFVGFSLMSISMMLCYTVSESLFFGAGIIWAPSVYFLSVSYIAQRFLRGYVETTYSLNVGYDNLVGNASLLSKLSIFNPLIFGKALGNSGLRQNMYSACLRTLGSESGIDTEFSTYYGNVGYEKAGSEYVLPIIVWLIFSALFVFIAKKLLDNRKLENTAIHSSSKFATVFVALEVSVFTATFLMGVLVDFDVVSSKLPNILVSLILGALVYLIFLSISRRKIKHTFGQILPCIVSSFVVIVACVICINGGFGYSTYSPDYKKVDYVTITAPYLDASGVMSNDQFKLGYFGADGKVYLEYQDETISLGKFNTKESIEKIAKIQKYSYENELNNDDNSSFCVTVTYHLKNNKTVIRNYDNTNSNVILQILDLTDSKEYKDELEFLMSSKRANETSSGNYTEKGAYNEYYFSNFSGEENAKATLTNGEAYIVANDAFTKTQIENTPELRDAILKDIEEIGYKKLLTSSKAPLGAINFKYDENVSGYDSDMLATDASYYIWDNMVNTINYIKSINKMSAFSDTSQTGEISYATVTPIKNKISADTSFSALSFYKSDITNAENYYDYFDTDLNEKNVLNTYSGKKITDKSKISKLFNTSSIYSKCDENDYLVLFKFKNGIYLTKCMSENDAKQFVK